MPAFGVTGAQQLDELGRRLIAAGEGGLRLQVAEAMQAVGRVTVAAVPQSALDTLPRSGGLAAEVAAQAYTAHTSAIGPVIRTRLSAVGGMRELSEINAGQVEHPVYGQPDNRVTQDVTPGFFDTPIEHRAPAHEAAVHGALDHVAEQITRKV